MKVNSTLAFTLILLSLMVGAGVISAAWGYALGREALKGVTQPNSRPIHGTTPSPTNSPPEQDTLVFLKEAEIIQQVKIRMSGDARNSNAEPQSEVPRTSAEPPAAIAVAASPEAVPVLNPSSFPIADQKQEVALVVQSAQQQDGYLLLDVSLLNSGTEPVQFLYSFMDVTDDQGRAFSANTEGLPSQLPPNGETYSGIVSIPMALLAEAETLSLTLSDYPDQQLRLRVSGIPVVR